MLWSAMKLMHAPGQCQAIVQEPHRPEAPSSWIAYAFKVLAALHLQSAALPTVCLCTLCGPWIFSSQRACCKVLPDGSL